ncbi:WD40 domain protein [Medicago truncatula]|uniref:WD40 domain protein n=1 Tax=Medicago truncatula TaxID=3880 RepID=A0A072UNT6_MEDTR|nr:WD40 domain protein [Medicago truncatula]
MDTKNPKEELFQNFLYDYLKKKGLSNTAEIFKNEAHVTGHFPPEFDKQPHGLLHDFWSLYNDSKSRQQMPGPSSRTLAGVLDSLRKTTPQIILEGHSIQELACISSGQSLLSCDLSSDGKIVASGGIGKKPFICYLETGLSVTALESHLDTIFEVRFQPGSTVFATSSADKTVKLWDANSPERSFCNVVGHNGTVRSLDFHPLGGVLCTSDTCDVIKVWDLHKNVLVNEFKAGSLVRFQPGSGKLLAVANRNVITIIDTPTMVVIDQLQGHVKDINSICLDVTGNMIASVSEDEVRVWSDRRCIFEYQSNGKRFQSVIFHPRYPNVLVVAGFQCLELLILETEKRRNKGGASDVLITGLAATTARSEFNIASASSDSVVKIWK